MAILLPVLACWAPMQDIPFHIVAVYRANTAGYQIHIETQGVVRAGNDISDSGTAYVEITPLASRSNAPLTIEIDAAGSAAVSTNGKPLRVLKWFSLARDDLRRLLEQVGYTNLSPGELDETIQVVSGAMAGSKAVSLKGQTSWLEVVDVKIN
jgi:hypothetical protein